MNPIVNSIEEQKLALSAKLVSPMEKLAQQCAEIWPDKAALDRILSAGFSTIPLCRLVYAIDPAGRQISANVSAHELSERFYGQDLSRRPFMTAALPSRDLFCRMCMSAGHGTPDRDRRARRFKGRAGRGFHCGRLRPARPAPERCAGDVLTTWRQIKGDPSIRETVFMQQRANSALDSISTM